MRSAFIILGVVVLFCVIQNGHCDENSENLEAEEVTFENTVEYGRLDVFKEWLRDAINLIYKRVVRPFDKLDSLLTHIKEKRPIIQAILQPVIPKFKESLQRGLETVKDAYMDRLKYDLDREETTNEEVRRVFNKMKGKSKAFLDKIKSSKCKEDMIEKITKWELIYTIFVLNCQKPANLVFSLVRMPHRKLLYQMNKHINDVGHRLESCKTGRFFRSKKYPCFKSEGEIIKADYEKLNKLTEEMRRRDHMDEVEMKASKWLANSCAESTMKNYDDALQIIENECPK